MLNLEKMMVDLLFTLKWETSFAKHEDSFFAKLNLWREYELLPTPLKEVLIKAKEGEIFTFRFSPGELFSFNENLIFEIDPKVNFRPPQHLSHLKIKLGRFYPLGFFRFLPRIYSGNPFPGRIISQSICNGRYLLDANHPLSRIPLTLEVKILKIYSKDRELGGRCKDWIEEAFRIGPGMQDRFDHLPTDFGIDERENFYRQDESDDSIFYRQPRFIGHIDRLCHQNLVNLYATILPSQGKILDLMSSFESHLPDFPFEVVGLGINKEELIANPRLNYVVVKDLNKDPSLPFEDEAFEAIVCDLSIEYVTKPLELIREIKRCLKKGGIVTFSFSNRYFPEKVIKLWIDLHEFERMGYVLELLIKNGFVELHTFSLRGYPRPEEDRWIWCTSISDPLYVVWGKKP